MLQTEAQREWYAVKPNRPGDPLTTWRFEMIASENGRAVAWPRIVDSSYDRRFFPTQSSALRAAICQVKEARWIAYGVKCALQVYRVDGTLRETRHYGRDPKPQDGETLGAIVKQVTS